MRSSGLKKPTPVAATAVSEPAGAKPPTTDEPAADNDPIAVTMQQREAIGGLNNQVTDAEATKKKFKIFRAPRLAAKGAMFIDLVGGEAESSTAASSSAAARPATAAPKPVANAIKKTPSNVGSSKVGVSRPQTALPGRKPVAAAAAAVVEETSVTPNENLQGVNDPVAHAMQQRLKAGGLASVVKEVDAKKQGMPMSSAPKHVVKPGSNALLSLVVDNAAAAASQKGAESAKAIVSGLKSPVKKSVSLQTAAKAVSALAPKPKPTGGANGGEASCQLDGDLSSDPIAQTMAIRIKLGGVNNNATEADAKKNNYVVFKAAKHPAVKSAALVDLALPPKAPEAPASPKKVDKKASFASKPPAAVKPSTALPKVNSKLAAPENKKKVPASSEIDMKDLATHEEDPIAASLRARGASGGLSAVMKEAEAKKASVFVPAALGLKVGGKDALISFDLPAPEK